MKLNVSGNPIIISNPPLLLTHAANKKYVDDTLNAHANDTGVHMSFAQNELLTNFLSVISDVNYLSDITSNVQDQLNSKLNKSGGTLTGFLTLHTDPTLPAHASTKKYVDDGLDLKLDKVGGTLTGFLTLHSNPTAPEHASNKQYVDTQLTNHSQNNTLHTTEAQSTWLNEVTATASEVNRLTGVTGNVQTQLDERLSKSGGTLTGGVNLAADVAIHSAKTPTAETELVNKAYVDFKVGGKEWKDPITSSTLLSFTLSVPPVAPEEGDTHIVATGGVGAWNGFDGYAVQYKTGTWQKLHQNRQVTVGDRFGVALTSASTPENELIESHHKLITITGGVVGAFTFDTEVQTPGSSTIVFDKDAVDFGYTYTLSDDDTWTITNTSVNLTNGVGLNLTGRILSIAADQGLIASVGNLSINANKESGLNFSAENKLEIVFDGDSIVGSLLGLKLNNTLKSKIEDSVGKSGISTVTGSIHIDATGGLTSDVVPTQSTDVITKGYVDTIQTNLSGLITALTSTVTTLNTDPVTKTYVDTQLTEYVSKSGATMSGALFLNANPTSNLHAATKQYVDTNIGNHVNNTNVHISTEDRTLLTELSGYQTALGYIADLTSSAQSQLDNKLALNGGTMTGMLTLYADPTLDNHAATKSYVDTSLSGKLDKSGGVMTGHIELPGLPTIPSHAASKEYVDSAIEYAGGYTDTAVANKLDKGGGTMTGFITLHAGPSADLHVASKKYVDDSVSSLANTVSLVTSSLQNRLDAVEPIVTALNTDPVTKTYVDTQFATKLDLAGGLMTGHIQLVSDPTAPLHPATKQYVDTVSLGLRTKASVRLATTGGPLSATYNNGSAGVNATLTAASNGALVVDGKNAVLYDRILVKDQTLGRENGDYVVVQVGDPGNPFILRRVETMDEASEINGSYFNVYDGNTLKGTGWVIVVNDPATFVLGTDTINVNQFFGPGAYIAGAGMTMSGNTFTINTASSSRIVVNADDLDLATTGVTPGTYTSITVDAYGRATAATSPTTLTGYGITDAQPLNAKLTSYADIAGRGLLVIDNTDTTKVRKITTAGIGISLNNDGTGAAETDLVLTSNATSANTADTIVSRDASGNFVANVITANLTGKASTADALQTSRTFSITGDGSASAQTFDGTANLTLTLTLANVVSAGDYTKVTVNAKGLVTGGSNPTTLDGYGITDAVPLATYNAKIAELEAKILELHNRLTMRT